MFISKKEKDYLFKEISASHYQISQLKSKLDKIKFEERVEGTTADIIFINDKADEIILKSLNIPREIKHIMKFDLKYYFIEKIKSQYYIGIKYGYCGSPHIQEEFYMIDNNKVINLDSNPFCHKEKIEWISVQRGEI